MTTIAFSLPMKKLAYDSRITSGADIITDAADKHRTENGFHFFMCGAVPDYEDLISAFLLSKHKIRKTIDTAALVWDGKELYEVVAAEGECWWHPVVSQTGAIGSGAAYAVAALESGATPRQAVKMACIKNCTTGGRINTFRLR